MDKDIQPSFAVEHQHAQPVISSADPLLSCLLIYLTLQNQPMTIEQLTTGLPITEKNITPSLFVRAAERVGYTALAVEKKLSAFEARDFPAVLLLKNQKACVLLNINDKGLAQIIYPNHENSVEEITIKVLNKKYSGDVFLMKSIYELTDRSEITEKTKHKNWFWSVIFKSAPIYSEVIIASILINIFVLIVPLFTMNVYDRVVPNNAIETLWVLVTGVCIVFVFDFIVRTLRSYFLDVAARNIDVKLSSDIFEQMLGIRMEDRPESVGVWANKVQSFSLFREFVSSSVVAVLIDVPFALSYIAVIYMLASSLAWIPIFYAPLIIVIGFLMQAPLNKKTEESHRHAAERHATLFESLSGIETIKSVGGESVMQSRWEEATTLAANLSVKLRLITSSSLNLTLAIQNLATVTIIIYGVYEIAAGNLTAGALIASTILTSRAMAPMTQVIGLLTRYHHAKNALTSLDYLMDLPTDKTAGHRLLHQGPLKGGIELLNVNFSYPHQPVQVLTNISFKINPGERVGIIGRNGSGKTTIAKLIMGFYQPSAGEILLDGIEQHQIDKAQCRREIGFVSQDAVLFYGSVRDNITLGYPRANDEEILQAAKISGIDAFISKHPSGFDLQVGERGSHLSNGQRQGVMLARTLLLNPVALLLDEPSNSIDNTAELKFKANLSKFIKDNTLILITHKASMLSLVNRVIVLDNGRIVLDGPKETVLQQLHEGKVKVPVGQLS